MKQRWRFTKNKLPRFYVGQKVIITDCTCGHGFNEGEVVTLTKANKGLMWDLEARYCEPGNAVRGVWVFDEDDCKPYRKGDK